MALSTPTVARQLGITRQAVLARARRMKMTPALVDGGMCFWDGRQVRKLSRAPRLGRPRTH